MLFKPKKDVLGIDIGSTSVKIAQLKEVKGEYHLVSLGMALLPQEAIVDGAVMDSNTVVDVVSSLIQSQQIKTTTVATSISGHSVIIRKIQVPLMTEEEMEASIQWEAEQYIPFEYSEVNADFQILGTDEKDPSQMNVILVAAKKEFVNDYVSVLAESGLNPVVMDIDCFAIQNAFELNYGIDEEAVTALIDMGASGMTVNILKGGDSVFTRDIQVGGYMFNEEIQKRLGLSSEDAERVKLGEELEDVDPSTVSSILADAVENLCQEVQRSLDFFSATSSDEKVDSIYLTGGVCSTPRMTEALEQKLAIPVRRLNPFSRLVISDSDFDPEYIQSIGPLFSVSIGLAMRSLGDK